MLEILSLTLVALFTLTEPWYLWKNPLHQVYSRTKWSYKSAQKYTRAITIINYYVIEILLLLLVLNNFFQGEKLTQPILLVLAGLNATYLLRLALLVKLNAELKQLFEKKYGDKKIAEYENFVMHPPENHRPIKSIVSERKWERIIQNIIFVLIHGPRHYPKLLTYYRIKRKQNQIKGKYQRLQ